MTQHFSEVEQQQHLLQKKEETASKPTGSNRDLEGSLTKTLIICVLAATLGGAFQFGYHLGNVNLPGENITNWFGESHYDMFNETLSPTDKNTRWSIAVGIFAIGGMIGGLSCGLVADKLGRKGGLMANNGLAVIAAAFMTFSKPIGVYYLFGIGRLIIGINAGLNSGLVPMYLTEVSPINLRGSLGSTNQLLVTISILFAQILGLPYIFGSVDLWPYIFAFSIVPVIFMLVTLPFCPESPKYTLIVKGDREKAEADLKKLRNRIDVTTELELIDEEAAQARSQPKVSMAALFGHALRWPLFIAVMMMLSQQLSGINVAMFYSTAIFKNAGLIPIYAAYATIAMGFINVVQTLISVWLVDHPKFGRRSLHLAGLFGMMVSSILIVGALVLYQQPNMDVKKADNTYESLYPWSSYFSIVFVLLFVISFATGPGSIPWFFVSEIFPSNARGPASSVACMTNWTANFIVSTSFPIVDKVMNPFTFLFFSAFLAFFIFFTFKFVPETKGKSVEAIHEEMNIKQK